MDDIVEIKDYGDDIMKKLGQPIFHVQYPKDKLSLYSFKGLLYMIAQVDKKKEDGRDSYIIAYEEEGKVKTLSSTYKNNYFKVETFDRSYILQPDVATMYDKVNDLGSQLIYVEPDFGDGVKGSIYACLQWNPNKLKKVFLEYDVIDHPNPSLVVNYLDTRRPNYYEFTVGGRIIQAKKGYVLNDENGYHRCIRKNHRLSKVYVSRSYSDDDMKSFMQKDGFNENVPSELIQLYKGNITSFNDIQNLTDEYIKSIK